jgi:ankyrin repeat protein
LACIRGDELTIKYLLEKGASTTVVDRDGCTPLHYLCESQNYEMVKLLIPLCQVSKDVRNRFGKKPADLVCDKDIKRLLRRDTSQSRRGSQ